MLRPGLRERVLARQAEAGAPVRLGIDPRQLRLLTA